MNNYKFTLSDDNKTATCGDMKITLLDFPTSEDWIGVRKRALVTVGKETSEEPSFQWKTDILTARHSPIRYLRFSFLLENIPYYASVHLCRHVHAQPYVRSQRNDRQDEYDRNAARQDAPVNMIWDMNAEELIVIENKRLCNKADPLTNAIAVAIMGLVDFNCTEFLLELVPMCLREGRCHEMKSCGMHKRLINTAKDLSLGDLLKDATKIARGDKNE